MRLTVTWLLINIAIMYYYTYFTDGKILFLVSINARVNENVFIHAKKRSCKTGMSVSKVISTSEKS